jgi:hypothetical protein
MRRALELVFLKTTAHAHPNPDGDALAILEFIGNNTETVGKD